MGGGGKVIDVRQKIGAVIGERGSDRLLATYHRLVMTMDKEFEACGDRLKDEMHFLFRVEELGREDKRKGRFIGM